MDKLKGAAVIATFIGFLIIFAMSGLCVPLP